MSDNEQIIRGVLIQVADARLLLPNATIAEVLSFASPDAVENAPAWLLGRIRWRGWQLPLVSFSRFTGLADEEGGLGSKVIVLKALGGDAKRPFFALLTQGFPRLVTVTEAALQRQDEELGGAGGQAEQAQIVEREPLFQITDFCGVRSYLSDHDGCEQPFRPVVS